MTVWVPVIVVMLLSGGGLIVGSFLNVVICRVPDGRSVVRPRSRCPSCSASIAARDNIPVVSWLLLRGRCRQCAQRISWRYPLVELATMLVWLVLGGWALLGAGEPGMLPLLLVIGSAGVALVVIDVEHHRLPDAIVLPLYPLTIAGLALSGLVSGRWAILAALAGAGIWVLVVGLPWLVSGGRGMGFGDVKLAPVLGATLGWVSVPSAVVGLFAGFVLGALVGGALMLLGRAGRRTALAFGPFLIVGAFLGLLVGLPLAQAYWQWLSA